MAEHDLIVEDEILKVSTFRRHEYHPVRRVERGDGAIGARFESEAPGRASVDADPAAEADIPVQFGNMAEGFSILMGGMYPALFRFVQGFDRT